MASRSKLVNLDAMIPRADFAIADSGTKTSYERFNAISVKDLKPDGLIRPLLRKPDFQRETSHWTPQQVTSLLDCFVNGDLIPSVIVWDSPQYLFVIDGGHRLSVLRAWVEDDYGDGPISRAFFGNAISKEQIRAAEQTRSLIAKQVDTWQHVQARLQSADADEKEQRRISTAVSRGIHVQWVEGNAEKAETSFFKINTKDTPLDNIEEQLLSNRRKSLAIAARAIIRAGMGHRYWSNFDEPLRNEIESLAKKLNETLFNPELNSPIKTLDLPLGGSNGVRSALEILLEFLLIANRDQQGEPKKLSSLPDDTDGEKTKEALTRGLALASRMTGNVDGSLGLLLAIYFYGPTGRHSTPMFLGASTWIGRKLANNDKEFFKKFTDVRAALEDILVNHKDLIATILQRTISTRRISSYSALLQSLVDHLTPDSNRTVSEDDIVNYAGLAGKVLTGNSTAAGKHFTDDTKSAVFIKTALRSAMRCPICNGYLDPSKSVSYDHIQDKKAGGLGNLENCQLTHHYCNQSVKNA